MIPKSIKIKEGSLVIVWNDGAIATLKLSNLRYNCPCAICNNEKEKRGIGSIPIYNENEIGIADIRQVGNYALAITWKDGHNTGIYNFDFLSMLTDNESKTV